MQSRSTRWESQPYDVALAGRLAGDLGVSRIVGAILARRGFADSEDARRFLAAEQRHDPLGLPGVPGRLRADPRPPAPGLADRGVRRLRRRRRLLDRHARPRPARARGRPRLGAAEPLRRGLRPLGRRRRAACRSRHRAAGHRRLRHHRRRAGRGGQGGGPGRGRHRPPPPRPRAARLRGRASRARRLRLPRAVRLGSGAQALGGAARSRRWRPGRRERGPRPRRARHRLRPRAAA